MGDGVSPRLPRLRFQRGSSYARCLLDAPFWCPLFGSVRRLEAGKGADRGIEIIMAESDVVDDGFTPPPRGARVIIGIEAQD